MTRATDQQHGVETGFLLRGPQLFEDLAREADSIDDDADGRIQHTPALQPFRGLAGSLQEGSAGIAVDDTQPGGLGRFESTFQFKVGVVILLQSERARRFNARCRREQDGPHFSPANLLHGVEGLPKRFRQMGLVQQDQAVLAEQSGVNRLHAIRHAVTPKQQPRTDLIDGRAENGRLRRRPRPIGLQWRAPAKSARDERRLSFTGQTLQATGYLDYGPVERRDSTLRFRRASRLVEGLLDLRRAFVGIVHHEASIDDQGNPQRSTRRTLETQRQVKDGRVQRRGLARTRGQIQHIGPFVVLRQQVDQTLLPRKRRVSVDRTKEDPEVGGAQVHDQLPRRRHSPRPANRPAPSSTGPVVARPKSTTA